VIPCYDIGEEEESELSVVLREALWAYIEYKRIPPNPRLGAMTIIPLTLMITCLFRSESMQK